MVNLDVYVLMGLFNWFLLASLGLSISRAVAEIESMRNSIIYFGRYKFRKNNS